MADILDENPGIINAKSPVFGLINGETGDKRLDTFMLGGDHLTKGEIISKVRKLIPNNSKMRDVESQFELKVGSFSALPFHEWSDKVIKLWQNIDFYPEKETLESSINKVLDQILDQFRINTGNNLFTPLTIEEAFPLVKKGRNSGMPFCERKWATQPEYVDYYKTYAQDILEGGTEFLKSGYHQRILFKRTQSNGETPKMRPVECPPKSEAIAGKCFTSIFIDTFKDMDQFCGFKGGRNISSTARRLLKKENLLSSDFSSFDARCVHLIEPIFEAIKLRSPEEFYPYFDFIKDYYTHSELITPFGILKSNDKNGLNSGDAWTSVLGTIANAICNDYTINKLGIEAEILSFGDDCVVVSDQEIDIELYSKFMSELGMECNPEKQELSKERFSFLGYYFFKQDLHKEDDQLPVFPIMRALSSLIYFETFNKVEDMIEEVGMSEAEYEELLKEESIGIDLMGYIMKLDNCSNHEQYREFVELFRQYEPYQINSSMILPFEKLAPAMKYRRYLDGKGLGNSPTMSLVYQLEAKELVMYNEVREELELLLYM